MRSDFSIYTVKSTAATSYCRISYSSSVHLPGAHPFQRPRCIIVQQVRLPATSSFRVYVAQMNVSASFDATSRLHVTKEYTMNLVQILI